MVCHTTTSQILTNFPVMEANFSIFTTFYPFLPHFSDKTLFYSFTYCIYAFYSSNPFKWCAIHAYKRKMKNIEYGGAGQNLPPPKKGRCFRSQFRRGSIIVPHHIKNICGNFHACIMILQLFSKNKPSINTA